MLHRRVEMWGSPNYENFHGDGGRGSCSHIFFGTTEQKPMKLITTRRRSLIHFNVFDESFDIFSLKRKWMKMLWSSRVENCKQWVNDSTLTQDEDDAFDDYSNDDDESEGLCLRSKFDHKSNIHHSSGAEEKRAMERIAECDDTRTLMKILILWPPLSDMFRCIILGSSHFTHSIIFSSRTCIHRTEAEDGVRGGWKCQKFTTKHPQCIHFSIPHLTHLISKLNSINKYVLNVIQFRGTIQSHAQYLQVSCERHNARFSLQNR